LNKEGNNKRKPLLFLRVLLSGWHFFHPTPNKVLKGLMEFTIAIAIRINVAMEIIPFIK
jgi:hypothetical protein